MSSIIRDSKSVVCGAMFAAIGVGAFIAALSYPFGNAQRMGPGFFPMMLSGLLALLGILIAWPWKCRRRQSDHTPLGWRRVR